MRRSLKILDGAADETIDDLFSTMSEVEKMGRMEQTLLRMKTSRHEDQEGAC